MRHGSEERITRERRPRRKERDTSRQALDGLPLAVTSEMHEQTRVDRHPRSSGCEASEHRLGLVAPLAKPA